MASKNILVRAVGYLEIFDFVQNIVLRDTKYKVRRVLATESVNIYRVQLVVKKSFFSRETKFCDFKAYDDYFEFEDMNADGKFNAWWLCFLLVRCITYQEDYLPKGETNKGYSYKVQEFLRSNNIIFFSNWNFYERVEFEDEKVIKLIRIECEDAKRKLEYGENICVGGTNVYGVDGYWPKGLHSTKNLASIDFPQAIDKNGKKYILGAKLL